MLTPTAPYWSSDEEAPTNEAEACPQMLQCTIHPAHATNNGMWILTIIWMASQGYAITGVWLTVALARPYQREPDDDIALN